MIDIFGDDRRVPVGLSWRHALAKDIHPVLVAARIELIFGKIVSLIDAVER